MYISINKKYGEFLNIHKPNQIHKERIIEKENHTRREPSIFSENQIVYMEDAKSRNNKANPPHLQETLRSHEG